MKRLRISTMLTVLPGTVFWTSNRAFIGWLALSAGIVAGSTIWTPTLSQLYPIPMLLSMVPTGALALFAPRLPLRAAGFFFIGVALILSCLAAQTALYGQVGNPGGDKMITGRAISIAYYQSGGYRFLVRADSVTDNQGSACFKGAILQLFSPDSVCPGSKIRASGRLMLPQPRLNPNGFDQYTHQLSIGIAATFQAHDIEADAPGPSITAISGQLFRNAVGRTLDHLENSDRRAIFEASFLGERHSLSPDLKDLFREAGIFHLLAISGLHVAILSIFITALLSFLPRPVALILTLATLWAYLLFVGFIPSLTRAVIMASVVLLSFSAQRRAIALNSLGVAGIVLLAMSPQSLFTPGYQLSFAATAGILLITPLMSKFSIRSPRLLRPLVNGFIVSLAGFTATMPILVHHFGTVSFFGLFLNVAAVGIMTVALWLFFIAVPATMIVPAGGALFMVASDFLMRALVWGAGLSRLLPFSSPSIPNPPIALTILYAVSVLLLLTVRSGLRIRFLVWTSVIAFAVTPIILLLHGEDTSTRLIFFSARKEGLAGLRPRAGVDWIISTGYPPSPSAIRNAITPWNRTRPPREVNLLMLRPPRDTTGWNALTPSRVLYTGFADVPTDSRSAIALHRLNTATRVVTTPACTCGILPPQSRHLPFGLHCTFEGVAVDIGDNSTPSPAGDDDRIVYTRATGQGRFRPMRLHIPPSMMPISLWTKYHRHLKATGFCFTPENDGAVTIHIRNGSIVGIRALVSPHHPIRAVTAFAPF